MGGRDADEEEDEETIRKGRGPQSDHDAADVCKSQPMPWRGPFDPPLEPTPAELSTESFGLLAAHREEENGKTGRKGRGPQSDHDAAKCVAMFVAHRDSYDDNAMADVGKDGALDAKGILARSVGDGGRNGGARKGEAKKFATKESSDVRAGEWAAVGHGGRMIPERVFGCEAVREVVKRLNDTVKGAASGEPFSAEQRRVAAANNVAVDTAAQGFGATTAADGRSASPADTTLDEEFLRATVKLATARREATRAAAEQREAKEQCVESAEQLAKARAELRRARRNAAKTRRSDMCRKWPQW